MASIVQVETPVRHKTVLHAILSSNSVSRVGGEGGSDITLDSRVTFGGWLHWDEAPDKNNS